MLLTCVFVLVFSRCLGSAILWLVCSSWAYSGTKSKDSSSCTPKILFLTAHGAAGMLVSFPGGKQNYELISQRCMHVFVEYIHKPSKCQHIHLYTPHFFTNTFKTTKFPVFRMFMGGGKKSYPVPACYNDQYSEIRNSPQMYVCNYGV